MIPKAHTSKRKRLQPERRRIERWETETPLSEEERAILRKAPEETAEAKGPILPAPPSLWEHVGDSYEARKELVAAIDEVFES